MQNKPNLGQSQIFVTVIKKNSYSEKSELGTWSKQTQTNPIYDDPFGIDKPIYTAL